VSSVAQDVRVALMTAPSAEVAERIVRELVEAGVVACGNIVPGVTSIYRWQGSVERESEVLVVFKTVERRVAELIERVRALHPYDVPELLVLNVADGNPSYIGWVQESVVSTQPEKHK
jgi:periplasmic divalent cation tolerance protein